MKKTPQQETKQAMADIERARKASEILSNPLYTEAIENIKYDMFEQFGNTKLGNVKERHELWQRMQLIKQFQDKFENIVKQGTRAEDTLSLLQKGLKAVNII